MLNYNISWTNVLSLWFENHTNSLKILKTEGFPYTSKGM